MSDKSEACPLCGEPVGEEPVSNSVEGISNGLQLLPIRLYHQLSCLKKNQ